MEDKRAEITYGTITVTPEYAEKTINESLEHFKNRHINPSTVRMYAKDMSNGKWVRNGETVKFNPDGYLNDGYHRFSAVVESGVAVVFDVAYNVPDDLVPTIDVGRTRSVEDILDFYGVDRIKGVMAVVRKRVALDKKITWKGSSCAVMCTTKEELIEEYLRHKEQYDKFKELGDIYKKNSSDILSATDTGGISAHLVMTLGWGEDLVDEFFTRVSTESWNNSNIFSKTAQDISTIKRKNNSSKNILEKYYLGWNSFVSGNKKKRHTELKWFIENGVSKNVVDFENCIGVGLSSDDFGITNANENERELAYAEAAD